MNIKISDIRADDRAQPRAMFDTELVAQYAEAMANGDEFPPVIVFHDGVDYFLADGFHRYRAAASLEWNEIDATVREGTLRDAILFSCSANAAHGWRRSNDDKRRAVLRLLNDSEWAKWSDREIARQCNVSQPFVSGLRPKPVTDSIISEPRTYTTRHGTIATMNTANIGAAPRQQQILKFEAPATWRDTAAPERVTEIETLNREVELTNLVWEIVQRWERLPDPGSAGQRFPADLLHSIDCTKVAAVGAWFRCFGKEIQARKENSDAA